MGLQTQGVGQGYGTQGVNGLGLNGAANNGLDMQQMKSLLQQIKDALAANQTKGNGGAKAAQPSQDASNAADDGQDLEKLFRKLQELAAQNPQALAQVLKQNPQLTGVVQAALSGGNGGGSVGHVGKA